MAVASHSGVGQFHFVAKPSRNKYAFISKVLFCLRIRTPYKELLHPYVKSLLSWASPSLGFSPFLAWQNLSFCLLSCTSKEFVRRQTLSVLQSIAAQEDWLISEEVADPFEVLYLVLLLNATAISCLGLIFSPQFPGYITAPRRISERYRYNIPEFVKK
jgi:hypothetical protein